MNKKDLKSKMISKIHIGKIKLGLNDVNYRLLLKTASDGKKESSKDMNIFELKEVLSIMKSLGFDYHKPKEDNQNNNQNNNKKYFTISKDDTRYLSERQVKYIKGLWWQNAKNPNEETLKAIIKKLTGFESLSECRQKEANILISAFSNME